MLLGCRRKTFVASHTKICDGLLHLKHAKKANNYFIDNMYNTYKRFSRKMQIVIVAMGIVNNRNKLFY